MKQTHITRKFLFLFLLFLPAFGLFGQEATFPQLVGGPMFGHISTTEARVWLMLTEAKTVKIELDAGDGHRVEQQLELAKKDYFGDYFPIVLAFTDLHPAQEYVLHLEIDGKRLGKSWTFFTLSENKYEDFAFLTGSCAYIGKGVGKLVEPPGDKHEVYLSMLQQDANFMLWLGDNVYYLNGEYNSYKRMMKKMITIRKKPELNAMLCAMPQYAIWDDHDYGPNDADRRWKRKDEALEVFARFWPNPGFGTEETTGNFCSFTHHDAEFFLMDDRYYRDKKDYTEFLGAGQLQWLKDGLKASDATFKFIAIGSQVVNDLTKGESYAHFYAERRSLFNFIKNENIPGVVFITGDRHFTEVLTFEQEDFYPFYDFTISPISNWIAPMGENHPERVNPRRVENTFFLQKNFARFSITGPEGDRLLTVDILDHKGNLLRKLEIHQWELEWNQ